MVRVNIYLSPSDDWGWGVVCVDIGRDILVRMFSGRCLSRDPSPWSCVWEVLFFPFFFFFMALAVVGSPPFCTRQIVLRVSKFISNRQ